MYRKLMNSVHLVSSKDTIAIKTHRLVSEVIIRIRALVLFSALLCTLFIINCEAVRRDVANEGRRNQKTAVQTKQLESAKQPGRSYVQFDHSNNALQIPFKIVDQAIIVSARVNDSIELNLALDTGFPINGAILFDRELGEKLGLEYVGQTPLGGGGTNTVKTANIAVGGMLSLPGVRFSNQQLLVVNESEEFKHWPVDGIMGKTIFDSCVAEIDYEDLVLNICDRSAFDFGRAGESFDLTFSLGIPVVEAAVTLDGTKNIPMKLIVDTGADVAMALYANPDKNIRAPQRVIQGFISEGIAGDVLGMRGRVAALRIGSLMLNKVITAFPTEGMSEVVATLGQDGFFGNVALQRFHVVFDYVGKRMYLKPNKDYSKPFEFNMAGLLLRTRSDGYKEVYDVIKDSPGDLQDIRKGDLIVAVNGRDILTYNSAELDRLFLQESANIELTIKRNSHRSNRKLTLRRII